jgi:hypothetical protein
MASVLFAALAVNGNRREKKELINFLKKDLTEFAQRKNWKFFMFLKDYIKDVYTGVTSLAERNAEDGLLFFHPKEIITEQYPG